MRMLLERAGHEVISAESGRRGLRLFFEDRPDLVVLDLRMPELDGWETLERLRDLSDVPVLIVSGQTPPPEELDPPAPGRRRVPAEAGPRSAAGRPGRRVARRRVGLGSSVGAGSGSSVGASSAAGSSVAAGSGSSVGAGSGSSAAAASAFGVSAAAALRSASLALICSARSESRVSSASIASCASRWASAAFWRPRRRCRRLRRPSRAPRRPRPGRPWPSGSPPASPSAIAWSSRCVVSSSAVASASICADSASLSVLTCSLVWAAWALASSRSLCRLSAHTPRPTTAATSTVQTAIQIHGGFFFMAASLLASGVRRPHPIKVT